MLSEKQISAKLRSEKDRLAELEDGGKWGSSEWSIQAKFVSDDQELYRQFKLYRESTIKRIQDQAAAEKRLAELAKEREKAEKGSGAEPEETPGTGSAAG